MAGPWRIRTRKPSGNVRVDFINPLARDIAFFYYYVSGTTFYDAVTGILGATAAGQTANSQGGLAFNGSARSASTTAWRNPNGALDNQLTVVAGLMLTSKPAGICFPLLYGTTGRGVGPLFNSSGFAGGGLITSAGFPTSVDAVDHTGQYVVLGSSSDGGTAGITIGRVNGVKQATGSGGSNGSATPVDVWMGRDGTGYNSNFTGIIYWAAGWNRLLSDAEHAAIAANPWQMLLPKPDLGWLSLDSGGGGNVTAALTGISSTAAQGTLGVKNTHALTGNASTASEGSVKGGQPLRGNQVAASEGALSPKTVVALTGNAMTASEGTLTPVIGVTVALTGNSSTAGQGTLGVKHTNPLTGNQVTAFEGTLTPSTAGNVTVALTGINMTMRQGTLIAVAPSALGTGGHFIPLTEKQLREQKKRERRDRQLRDDLDESRRLDAQAIEADIRATLAPKGIEQQNPVNYTTNGVDSDEDEAELELLLLHA